MPRLSLDARSKLQAQEQSDVPVVLVIITHELLDSPVYLSSDPTAELSSDPLIYGTRSRGIEYQFAMMSAVVPDDRERTPAAASLRFENVDADLATVARSVTTPASVTLRLVFASAPDAVEFEWSGMKVIKASGNADVVTLDLSREPITNEPFPAHYMTRNRFPGLFR